MPWPLAASGCTEDMRYTVAQGGMEDRDGMVTQGHMAQDGMTLDGTEAQGGMTPDGTVKDGTSAQDDTGSQDGISVQACTAARAGVVQDGKGLFR